ncbi:MAG: NAD-dependent protein deacylase [candidate division Zixibacteria bacterium]|nr:NAD-dependent protein deacylase [candidate division Zixibacteria bacterium]MDD5425701.1 NAD-dependent protein deacylase [candidate division Zixibacteria bacterium]
MVDIYKEAAAIVKKARRITGFTGAGISVESGIPPFRGEGGLWNKYDPACLDINYFYNHPQQAWEVIKEIFYDFFDRARPNAAHRGLAIMEQKGLLQTVITQNIDNLHQEAGSKEVFEYHGNSRYLICVTCHSRNHVSQISLDHLPPTCRFCGGLLKPDFVFFGEPIPELAHSRAVRETRASDVFILIGTTGEVMPASFIPPMAKQNGAIIIEMNIKPSNYTHQITDIFLEAKATETMTALLKELGLS